MKIAKFLFILVTMVMCFSQENQSVHKQVQLRSNWDTNKYQNNQQRKRGLKSSYYLRETGRFVNVKIDGNIAVTNIKHTFYNSSNRNEEAIYEFDLPQAAKIVHVAAWIANKKMYGAIVKNRYGQVIYNSYKRKKRDPVLIKQTSATSYHMSIFPIFPRSSYTVEIRYIELLPISTNVTYTYMCNNTAQNFHISFVANLHHAQNISATHPLSVSGNVVEYTSYASTIAQDLRFSYNLVPFRETLVYKHTDDYQYFFKQIPRTHNPYLQKIHSDNNEVFILEQQQYFCLVGRTKQQSFNLKLIYENGHVNNLGSSLGTPHVEQNILPRLWAIQNLQNKILRQARISDIVNLSQKWGIITPYTSYIVLESQNEYKRWNLQQYINENERHFSPPTVSPTTVSPTPPTVSPTTPQTSPTPRSSPLVNANVNVNVQPRNAHLKIADAKVNFKTTPIVNPEKTLGANRCIDCHKQEFTTWEQTAHSTSYKKTYKTANSKKILKNLGMKGSMKRQELCTQCHFTQQYVRRRLKAVSGVSCESCHGPAQDWLLIHNNMDKPRQERRDTCNKLGMNNSANIYSLMRNCYNCHSIQDEKLVNVGGHKIQDKFNLVSWSQGSIRHNFLRTNNQENAKITQKKLRVMFIIGLMLDMEYTLRGLSKAYRPGKYRHSLQQKVNTTYKALVAINHKVDVAEVKEICDLFTMIDLKNNFLLQKGANYIALKARSFMRNSDGSKLSSIDSLIPSSYK